LKMYCICKTIYLTFEYNFENNSMNINYLVEFF
jgi:hypothetical protein